jgi:hypothetical protein
MIRTSHSMARRRNEIRKGDIFENMDAQSSSSEEKGHLHKWVKKTEKSDQNERLKESTKVSSTEAHVGDSGDSHVHTRVALNRSCTYTLYCAIGHVYVVKPWGKGNTHGLEFDVMV